MGQFYFYINACLIKSCPLQLYKCVPVVKNKNNNAVNLYPYRTDAVLTLDVLIEEGCLCMAREKWRQGLYQTAIIHYNEISFTWSVHQHTLVDSRVYLYGDAQVFSLWRQSHC